MASAQIACSCRSQAVIAREHSSLSLVCGHNSWDMRGKAWSWSSGGRWWCDGTSWACVSTTCWCWGTPLDPDSQSWCRSRGRCRTQRQRRRRRPWCTQRPSIWHIIYIYIVHLTPNRYKWSHESFSILLTHKFWARSSESRLPTCSKDLSRPQNIFCSMHCTLFLTYDQPYFRKALIFGYTFRKVGGIKRDVKKMLKLFEVFPL